MCTLCVYVQCVCLHVLLHLLSKQSPSSCTNSLPSPAGPDPSLPASLPACLPPSLPASLSSLQLYLPRQDVLCPQTYPALILAAGAPAEGGTRGTQNSLSERNSLRSLSRGSAVSEPSFRVGTEGWRFGVLYHSAGREPGELGTGRTEEKDQSKKRRLLGLFLVFYIYFFCRFPGAQMMQGAFLFQSWSLASVLLHQNVS